MKRLSVGGRKQIAYNLKYNITPTAIIKSTDSILGQTRVADNKYKEPQPYIERSEGNVAADPVVAYMSKEQLGKALQKTRKLMEAAVKELDFIEAARLRDEMFELEKLIEKK